MKLGRPILLVLCAAALAAAGCTKVEPGYAGVRVNLYGSQRGVSSLPLVTGRVWYNPLTEEIYQFPTYMQNVVWTRNVTEGRPFDESFTANSLTTVYVRNQVRDAFSIEASKMAIMDIVGPGKPHLLNAVQHDLEGKLGPDGIHFDNVSIIGKTRLPEQVEASINSVIEATQRAQEAQNKVAQSRAEAEQRVAEANGIAQSVLIKAKAQADANRILNESLTPMLIQYEGLQRWNGTLPLMTGGGAIPMVQLPAFNATKPEP